MKAVSVIIPSYQSEKWLSATLDSCLMQEEFVAEIIVIDDHSTDRSWDIASEYQNRHPDLIKLLKNKLKGGNHARNYGFEISTGEYIQWLDADDQVLEKKFSAQLAAFKEDPAIDVVFSDWILHIYDEKGNRTREEHKRHQDYKDFLFELLINNWSPPLNYLVKRSIALELHAIKAWNPDTAVAQDREYFTMAAIIGAKFRYVPGFLSVYNRWNKNSVSAAQLQIRYANHEKIFNRFLEELNRQPDFTAAAKVKYRNVILTQKCLLKAFGVMSDLGKFKIGFSTIYWPIVHGYRTTLKLIGVIIKLQIKQRFGNFFA